MKVRVAPRHPAARKPLRWDDSLKLSADAVNVVMPLGIGDCHWVCTKLRALSAFHGGKPIHAYINKSPDHASVGYLQLVPFIEKATQTEAALYHVHEELDEPYKSAKWSTLKGSAGWNGFDYILVPNGHLESGKPLSTWMPELATEFSYDLAIPQAERDYARSLAAPGSVLLYPSGTGANLGFHRNTWTTKHWAEVIERLNAEGIVPVLVGAKSKADLAYQRFLKRACSHVEYVDTIGLTNIPQVLAMIEDAAVWCGLNSGLGIVSAMRYTPTLMLWADARYPIRHSSTYTMHPNMQRSWLSPDQLETYRTLSYGSPDLTPETVVRTIMEIRR
jgi:hypothetical protein